MEDLIIEGDKGCPTFVFAHGAGAAMDSDFMSRVSGGLAERGIRVVRFEFPYMQKQRETGRRRPPDRQPVLLEHFMSVLEQIDCQHPFIGGKSMGGRMATLLAADIAFPGVIVLGYPFHALGKPQKVRIDHFCQLKTPILICQGERDSMGSSDEVPQYRLPDCVQLEWFADGDHDLKPRKSSGFDHESHLTHAIETVSHFIHETAAKQTRTAI